MSPLENSFETETQHSTPTFVVGTERSVIDYETSGLGAEELIRYWSTFEPSSGLPYPSFFSKRHAVDDVAAVLSGSKPATLFEILSSDTENTLFNELLNRAYENEDLTVTQAGGFSGSIICITGLERTAQNLTRLYEDVILTGLPPSRDFHLAVGNELGYPIEAVEDYLYRTGK